MRRIWKRVVRCALIGAVLAAIAAGTVLLYRADLSPAPEVDAAGAEPAAPPQVKVTTVVRGDLARRTWVTGEIRAGRAVDLAAKIPGRVQAMRTTAGELIEEGARIEQGDRVAVMEHRDLDAAVRSAEANLGSAVASHALARVVYHDARREKDRWTALREQGVGTEQQLDQATTAYERLRAELRIAESRVKQAEAELHRAQVNLDEAWITAPFSGIVSRRFVDEGAFVNAGTPLLRLLDLDRVEITGGLSGRHFARIRAGESGVSAVVDAYPEREFTGVVTRLRPELETATRAVAVTVVLDNPGHLLKPGMYARLEITLEQAVGVPVIPDAALFEGPGGQTLVYVVGDGATVAERAVELGLRDGPLVEVVSGLRDGESVLIGGQRQLASGMTVAPQRQ